MILMGSKTQEGAHAVRSSSLPYLDPPHHLSTPSLSPPSRASIHVLHHLIEFHAGLVDAKEDNYLSPSHKNISVTMYHRPPVIISLISLSPMFICWNSSPLFNSIRFVYKLQIKFS